MKTVPEIFRAALAVKLERGDQTRISKQTGIGLKTVNHIVSGERQGSEDDRRAIAAVMGYDYDQFLDLGRQALGLPVSRKDNPPPAPEVKEYLDKARTLLEAGGPNAEALKTIIKNMKE